MMMRRLTSGRRFFSVSTVPQFSDPRELARHLEAKFCIGGRLVGARDTFAVHSPATGERLCGAGKGDARDVDAAVAVARAVEEVDVEITNKQQVKTQIIPKEKHT